ncbi:MAG: right-handed parallel beta-helix repeat-containing protein [Candidatus Aenigmarchaeota archaeon]|nr:right-handed parallel beta-helix repeat-containing protein [Candidatus Aenigmarchaeota archaeon]
MLLSDQCLGCGVTLTESYTLQNDMNCSMYNDTAVFISSDNVVFDCNYHKIVGNSSASGIKTDGTTNVTVKNCEVSNSRWGISYLYSDDGTIVNNVIHDIGVGGVYDSGIYLYDSENAYVFNNTVYGVDGSGIYAYLNSINHLIKNNNVTNCEYGIKFYSNSNGTASNNYIYNSSQYGIEIASTADNVVIFNNTIYKSGIGGIRFFNPSTANVTGNTINESIYGLHFYTGDPSGIIVYRNRIYSNNLNVHSSLDPSTQINLFYNQQGNYWGHDGDVCPGFIPGIDSNYVSVIDKYPYTDKAFTNEACSCGDVVIASTKLYRDVSCTYSQYGLILNNSNILLDCDGYTITKTSTSYGIGMLVNASNVTIKNCTVEKYGDGIYVENVTNVTLEDLIVTNNYYISGDAQIGHGIHLNNVSFSTISKCQIYDNGIYNIFINNTNNITITQSEIYGNTEVGLAGKEFNFFDGGNNTNISLINNYWGHNECPLFLYWRDTNSETFYDEMPWNSTHQFEDCSPQYKGNTIYKDLGFTQTIANNYSNSWYYYYNGSYLKLTFEIIPALFMVKNAYLFDQNDTKICELESINDNRTLWRANCSLSLNHSEFTVNPSYPLILHVNETVANWSMSVFNCVVNINPIDEMSSVYDSLLGGSTTDWSKLDDFSNVTNLTFEIPGKGKIVFTEPINLLDLTLLNALKSLKDYLSIEIGKVSIDTAVNALHNLNKSANVTMYNLPFERQPGILRNGEPDVLAGETDGNFVHNVEWDPVSKTLKFTVDSWSTYETDGTPPYVEILSPINKTYYVADTSSYGIPLRFVVTDDHSVDECWYSLDGGAHNVTIENCENITLTLNETHVTLIVYANDTVGNENSTNITFSAAPLKSDGESCTSAEECAGGYCVHGYCRNSPTYCGDGYCDDGEYHSTCPEDCFGGGGTTTSETIKQTHIWSSLLPGEIYVFEVREDALGVKSLSFRVPYESNNGKITIQKLDELPEDVKGIGRKVYQYFEVKVYNFEPEEVEMEFKVPKSWLSSNGIDRESVGIYRYESSNWMFYESQVVDEDDEYVYYRTQLPGLSLFGIGESKVKPPQTTVKTTTTVKPEEKPKTTIATTTVPLEEKKGGGIEETFIMVIVVVLVGSMLVIIGLKIKSDVGRFRKFKRKALR